MIKSKELFFSVLVVVELNCWFMVLVGSTAGDGVKPMEEKVASKALLKASLCRYTLKLSQRE
jgi:hypothetical protein